MSIEANALTADEKLNYVMEDYDIVATQYCDEFCDISRYNIYTYIKHYTEDEISSILEDNGFQVDSIEKKETDSENGYATAKLIIYASKVTGN